MSKYDVYGIGNALVDIEYHTSIEKLTELGIEKGLIKTVEADSKDGDIKVINFITVDAGCKMLGGKDSPIDKSTYYRGAKSGRFPKTVSIGPNSVRLIEHECEAVCKQRIAERDAFEPETT